YPLAMIIIPLLIFNTIIHIYFFFFFQAEDGIRDGHVTGVQTCALPICQEKLMDEKDNFDFCPLSALAIDENHFVVEFIVGLAFPAHINKGIPVTGFAMTA